MIGDTCKLFVLGDLLFQLADGRVIAICPAHNLRGMQLLEQGISIDPLPIDLVNYFMSIGYYSGAKMYTQKDIEEITRLYCHKSLFALKQITQLYFLSSVHSQRDNINFSLSNYATLLCSHMYIRFRRCDYIYGIFV